MDEVLSSLAGHGLVASRAAAQHAAREPGRPDEIEAVQYVALADESLREPITQRIGERQMRVWHTMLAEHPDEDYRLRHRLRHLTDAGANYTAREEANDVRWLARICNALGVDTLEAQLAYVHASVPPTDHTADAALR